MQWSDKTGQKRAQLLENGSCDGCPRPANLGVASAVRKTNMPRGRTRARHGGYCSSDRLVRKPLSSALIDDIEQRRVNFQRHRTAQDLNLQNKADAVGLPYMETPPTVASLRAKLVATLRWSSQGRPMVTLTNEGPAKARVIEYSLSTPPDDGPPIYRSGPWNIDRLNPGASDEQMLYGSYPPVVVVTATWTDDDQTHELSWSIDFPAKPVANPMSIPEAGFHSINDLICFQRWG